MSKKPYVLAIDDRPEELSFTDELMEDVELEIVEPGKFKLANLHEPQLVLVDYRMNEWWNSKHTKGASPWMELPS